MLISELCHFVVVKAFTVRGHKFLTSNVFSTVQCRVCSGIVSEYDLCLDFVQPIYNEFTQCLPV